MSRIFILKTGTFIIYFSIEIIVFKVYRYVFTNELRYYGFIDGVNLIILSHEHGEFSGEFSVFLMSYTQMPSLLWNGGDPGKEVGHAERKL